MHLGHNQISRSLLTSGDCVDSESEEPSRSKPIIGTKDVAVSSLVRKWLGYNRYVDLMEACQRAARQCSSCFWVTRTYIVYHIQLLQWTVL